MNYSELISSHGWAHYSTCTCSGLLQHKYKPQNQRFSSYKLVIFPTKNIFKISHAGVLLHSGQLADTFQQLSNALLETNKKILA